MEFTILFIAHHYYDFLMFLFFKSFQDKLYCFDKHAASAC